jgi:glycine/D-amino acid oxidase-like deaminating enzyme
MRVKRRRVVVIGAGIVGSSLAAEALQTLTPPEGKPART